MTQSYRDYSERNVSQLPQYKRIVLRLFYFFGLFGCGGRDALQQNRFGRGKRLAGRVEKRKEIHHPYG